MVLGRRKMKKNRSCAGNSYFLKSNIYIYLLLFICIHIHTFMFYTCVYMYVCTCTWCMCVYSFRPPAETWNALSQASGITRYWVYLVRAVFWVNFYIWCEVRAQLYSFVCSYLVVPVPFVERLFFSHLIVLASKWQKSFDHKYMGLFLDSRFYSIDLYVYRYTRTTQSSLQLLRSKYWNREVYAFQLFFFFKAINSLTF